MAHLCIFACCQRSVKAAKAHEKAWCLISADVNVVCAPQVILFARHCVLSLLLQCGCNYTVLHATHCRGVHGALIELLSCKPNLHTAVEVIGGNQLFHVVVDNDAVATRIVEVLTRDKMGRATFLPLNRINPSDVKYPDHGSDAVPMLKLLKFNSLFSPVIKQVSLRHA